MHDILSINNTYTRFSLSIFKCITRIFYVREPNITQLLRSKEFDVFLPLLIKSADWRQLVSQFKHSFYPCYFRLLVTQSRLHYTKQYFLGASHCQRASLTKKRDFITFYLGYISGGQNDGKLGIR